LKAWSLDIDLSQKNAKNFSLKFWRDFLNTKSLMFFDGNFLVHLPLKEEQENNFKSKLIE